jgi:S-adenosylmethionine hydrolase
VLEQQPFITLLTDYGLVDEFVGILHGVIASICPQARVIDLTHGVPRRDIVAGGAILAQNIRYMPVGIHVAVVDPKVGGTRRAVALKVADGRVLVGPDNGLMWGAAQVCGGIEAAVELSSSPWRLQPTSSTFHGRDIFVPVASHLATGQPFEQAGEPLDPAQLVVLERPPSRREGETVVAPVLRFDHFGNVQLAALLDELTVPFGTRIRINLPSGDTATAQLVNTFDDVVDGAALLFEDATQRLALALNQGSAERRYNLKAGDEVRITPVDA